MKIRKRKTALISFLLMISLLVTNVRAFQNNLLEYSSDVSTNNQTDISEITRIADYNTMESYETSMLGGGTLGYEASVNSQGKLNGSRYAGRVWADKTVLAQGAPDDLGKWDGNSLELSLEDDGIAKNIQPTSDFLHVFSAIGSTQTKFDTTPLDVVFVVDISTSMKILDTQRTETRMTRILAAVNNAIDYLMVSNSNNRVGVVFYTSNTPYTGRQIGLGRYIRGPQYPDENSDVPYNYIYQTSQVSDDIYFNLLPEDGQGNIPKENLAMGTATNIQAGLYAGGQMLAGATETVVEVNGKSISRVPIMFLLTDGAPNSLCKSQDENDTKTAWYEPYCYDQYNLPDPVSNLFTSSEGLVGGIEKEQQISTGGAIILSTLLTGSYMKSAINNHYSAEAKIYGISSNDIPESRIFSFGIDTEEILDQSVQDSGAASSQGEWARPRVAAVLDPSSWFTNDFIENPNSVYDDYYATIYNNETGLFDFRKIEIPEFEKAIVAGPEMNLVPEGVYNSISLAWKAFQVWEENDSNIPSLKYTTRSKGSFNPPQNGGISYGQLPKDNQYNVTKEQIINNICYINQGDLVLIDTDHSVTNVFTEIIEQINSELFNPVEGENDAGIENALTYTDPIGQYMEIKNIDNVLLFGQLLEVAQEAIYDYNWNLDYINSHGLIEFQSGWYVGEDPITAEHVTLEIPENAVYRINYLDAQNKIPNLIYDDDNGITEKQKNTKYTLFQIIPPEGVGINDFIFNPSYEFMENEDTGITDPDPDMAGIFTYSEISIWIEETDNYTNENSDNQIYEDYDSALWINLPADALPLQTSTIISDVYEDENGQNHSAFFYKTNLGADNGGDPEYYAASTPFRVFYSVGIDEEILIDPSNESAGVDLNLIDSDYLDKYLSEDNVITFYSNYYSSNSLSENNETVTVGNPSFTFSPSPNNVYYSFQRGNQLYGIPVEDNSTLINSSSQRPENYSVNIDDFNSKYLYVNNLKCPSVTESALSEAITSVMPNQLNSEGWYYIVLNYYVPNGSPKGELGFPAEMTYRAVSRRGAEFGSAIGGDEVETGAYLAWFNASSNTYTPFVKSPDYPPEDPESEWYITTLEGGLRVGDLESKIQNKNYIKDDQEINGNLTNTASTYYYPRISTSTSGPTAGEAVINIALGNNGLLSLPAQKVSEETPPDIPDIDQPDDNPTKPPTDTQYGNLTVQKNIYGDLDPSTVFDFVVTFKDQNNTWLNGPVFMLENNTVVQKFLYNGSCNFQLTANSSVSFINLPYGTKYVLDEVNNEETIPNWDNKEGTIASSKTTAICLNIQEEKNNGMLTINKVALEASPSESFDFVITLSNSDGSLYSNSINFIIGANETVQEAQVVNGKINFSLKAGESISFLELPYGTNYSLKEINLADYTVSWDKDNGIIDEDNAYMTATATNTKNGTVLNPAISISKTQAVNNGTRTANKVTVSGNDTITYYMVVTNISETVANNVVVTDAVPTGLTLLPEESSVGAVINDTNNAVSWTIATLNPGESATVSFTCKVPSGVAPNTTYTNTAYASLNGSKIPSNSVVAQTPGSTVVNTTTTTTTTTTGGSPKTGVESEIMIFITLVLIASSIVIIKKVKYSK